MKVLVTGATGFVGAHTAAEAAACGHEVRIFVRDRSKADRVMQAVGVASPETLVGDVTDVSSVRNALAGCEALVHAASVVALDRRRAPEALRVNAFGTENVLRAAAEAGLSRIVHVSSTSALQPAVGEPLRSEAPPAASGGYAASKARAEATARELQRAGAPVHITYPSGVIGPAAGESLGETSTAMARFVARGVVPTAHAALSLLDVRDLARIHVRLLDMSQPRDRIMCGGTCLTMPELAEQLEAVVGRRFRVLPIPPAALRAAGRLADLLMRVVPLDLPVTEESMAVITGWEGTADNMATLGVTCRPVLVTLTDAIGAWREAGLLTPQQAGSVPAVAATQPGAPTTSRTAQP